MMILFISIATLLLTIVLTFYNYTINKNGLYLSGFLIPISFSGILHYFFLLDHSVWKLALVYGHFMPLFYLAGPMLYFYIRGTLRDCWKLSKWDYLHFLPFTISLISIFPYYFEDFDSKLEIAKNIINDPNFHRKVNISWLYNNSYNLIIRPLFLFCYFLICIFLLIRHSLQKKKTELSKNQRIIMTNWLYAITILSGVCSASYFLMTLDYFNGKLLTRESVNSLGLNYIIGISFTLIPIMIIVFPQVIYGLPIASLRETKIVNKSTIFEPSKEDPKTVKKIENEEKETFQKLAEMILDYLKTEKPFTDPNYSLEDLASHLEIQKHHLYYCFNTVLNSRFTTIRTQLRVEYAKECLLKGDLESLSMEGVWTKTGFSSRTSFFVSFKDITGQTPLDFIKNNKLKPYEK